MSEGICWLLELQVCDAEISSDISMVLEGLTALQTGTTSQSAEFKQCHGFLFTSSKNQETWRAWGRDPLSAKCGI